MSMLLILPFLENLGFGRKTLGLAWSYKTSGVASCRGKSDRRWCLVVAIHIFSLLGMVSSLAKEDVFWKKQLPSRLGLAQIFGNAYGASQTKNAVVLCIRNWRGIWALHFLPKLDQKAQNFTPKQIQSAYAFDYILKKLKHWQFPLFLSKKCVGGFPWEKYPPGLNFGFTGSTKGFLCCLKK